MGLFGDLDVASANEDVFGVPDGTYLCFVSKVSVKEGNKADEHGEKQVGMTITFQVNDPESEYNEREITQYKRVPRKVETADEKRALGFLKLALMALDVPEERINTVDPEDLVGTSCYVTVKKTGEYTNVTQVKTVAAVQATDATFV